VQIAQRRTTDRGGHRGGAERRVWLVVPSEVPSAAGYGAAALGHLRRYGLARAVVLSNHDLAPLCVVNVGWSRPAGSSGSWIVQS
jgi:hypothetical protein